MTNNLGFQTLKICDPHGNSDIIVVKIDGNCLVAFSYYFGWIKLQEGPNDFGYGFRATNELDEYNINWEIYDFWELDDTCIGKLSLCAFQEDITPIITELFCAEDFNEIKKMKFKIYEQYVYNFETKEYIKLEPITTTVTMFQNDYKLIFEPGIKIM